MMRVQLQVSGTTINQIKVNWWKAFVADLIWSSDECRLWSFVSFNDEVERSNILRPNEFNKFMTWSRWRLKLFESFNASSTVWFSLSADKSASCRFQFISGFYELSLSVDFFSLFPDLLNKWVYVLDMIYCTKHWNWHENDWIYVHINLRLTFFPSLVFHSSPDHLKRLWTTRIIYRVLSTFTWWWRIWVAKMIQMLACSPLSKVH